MPDPATMPRTPEYLYGRIRVAGDIPNLFLTYGERMFRYDEETDSSEAILYRYAATREEGLEFAELVTRLGMELHHLGLDLQRFVKNHESEKWDD